MWSFNLSLLVHLLMFKFCTLKDKPKVCPFHWTRSSFLYRAGPFIATRDERRSTIATRDERRSTIATRDERRSTIATRDERRSLPSLLALNAAILLLSVFMLLSPAVLAQSAAIPPACSTPQVDDDGDGLIEICYIEDLDAVRYQLDGSAYRASASADKLTGGCPSGGCRGYELVRNLDFNSPPKSQFGSYRDLSNQALWTRDLGWLPIGGIFKGVFKGNGFRISNLYIDRGQSDDVQSTKVGLFAQVGEGARIEGLGLEIAAVRGYDQVGALVGENNGEIITSYVVSGTPGSGGLVGVQAMRSIVGGLAALNQTTNAAIVNSYALVDVATARTAGAKSGSAGGLVGINRDGGEISHSFASGDVSGPCEVGGLVGLNWTSNSMAQSVISTSYATGRATSGVGECDTSANRRGGGLVANNSGDAGSKIEYSYATGGVSFGSGSAGTLGGLLANQGADSETVASYWDTESSGSNTSADGIGATTAALQSPTVPGTTSAEVYYSWSSEAWDFGTASEYPALKYGSGLEVAESACRLVGDATSDLPRCDTFLVPELRYGLQSLTLDTSLISLSPPFNPQRSHYIWQPRGDLSDLAEFILEVRVINPASRIRIIKGGMDLTGSSGVSTATVSLDSAMGSLWAASASDRIIVEIGTNGTTVTYTIESAIGVDVDRDDDGLIEIDWIEDLEAVRYRLDGKGYRDGNSAPTLASGCPLDESGEVVCRGYELSRDLDFAAATSYRDAVNRSSYTEGVGWLPIGDAGSLFSGTFIGNNHRLSHLRIQRRDVDGAWGLFAETSDAAHIDGLALTSLAIDIASHDRGGHELWVGALVARNRGAITNSSAHGDITVRSYFPSRRNSIETGGLVARNVASSARIASCYALVRSEMLIFDLSRLLHQLGGLVAVNEGTIRSSYAIADLSVRDLSTDIANNQANIGGLVATNKGPIRDSYVLAIAETSNLDPNHVRRGGLVAEQSTGTITNSYWDAEYSGIASGVGTSQTGVALQSPIAAQSSDATQAYYLWESAAWDFGSSSQYPILKYNDKRCATAQAPSYCGYSLAAQGSLLRDLIISSGGGLSSRFSPAIAEYTIALSADRNTVELRPNAFAADAVLSVRRGTQELADSVSGDSTIISIEQAQTTVTFTVRSANRQPRDYRFVIHRLNSIVDVDADDDGLIEISKLEDLNAVRYYPDGSGYSTMTGSLKLTIGCPQSGCNGYELIDDLDFADAASYRDVANRESYYADSDGWQPLEFWGVHFDGNGHTIANLNVQTAGRGGLFAYLGPGSRLSRVGLLDAEVRGGNETGALVAFANTDSRIERCHASGRVTGREDVGGLVGGSEGPVSHSRSSVAVTGSRVDVGGLVGEALSIIGSYASGDVESSGNFVGGLAGTVSSIIDSHASGAVKGERSVGGLAGLSRSTISNSYASGAVIGSRSVGGLVGFFGQGSLSTIINSYAVGAVSGGMEVGGLLGTVSVFSERQQRRIINCYALGELSGTAAVGGLVGTSQGSFNSQNPEISRVPVSISNSYWNTQTSGVVNSTGAIQAPEFPNQEGTSLSTVQMQSPRVPGTTSTEAYYNWSVADWDFGSSTQYPAVRRSGSSALVARQRASLASLTVHAGERLWPLDTEQMQQDVEVEFEIEQITVTATTATPATLSLFVDDKPLSNGGSIDLAVLQPRRIRVVLVPQRDTTATRSDIIDNISTRTYIVTVVRQLSVDLRTLSVSSGDLEFALKPDFSRQNYDYKVQVANRIAELTVSMSEVDPKATIELLVNGVEIEITADGATKSAEVALVEGGTTILTVIVRSTRQTDSKPTQMYTIEVSREPSSDATLRALHVSNSVLMPDFAPGTSTYTAIVMSASTAVTVLATASNEHATLEVNGRRVVSGSPSGAITIAADATTPLRIVVTAQDMIAQETYTIVLSHSFPFIRIRSRLFLEAPLP